MVIALVFACVVAAAGVASAAMLWLERTRMARSAQEAREDAARARSEIGALRDAAGEAQRAAAALEARLGESQEREKREAERFQEQIRTLKESFNSLAGDALKHSNAQFLELAKQAFEKHHERTNASVEEKQKAVDALLKPIQEALKKTDEKLGAMEKERVGAYEGLLAQVRQMQEAGRELTEKTGDLVKALRKPQVRGRYGEIQLERVLELSGMRPYCDFDAQASTRDSEGNLLRPDVVVRLPNERAVVIDAKCNIDAYLDAMEADNEVDAEAHLVRFARHIAEQAKKLNVKNYSNNVKGGVDLVVMFVPGDQLIDAALMRQSRLIEEAADIGVILASPSTLLGLLRAIYVGWREKSVADSAEELRKIGQMLHERVGTMFAHFNDLGRAIEQAVDRYNKVGGSLDRMLIPAMRRFEEAKVKSQKVIEETRTIESSPRFPEALLGEVEKQE
jgi:DNA recombination protein RmuC